MSSSVEGSTPSMLIVVIVQVVVHVDIWMMVEPLLSLELTIASKWRSILLKLLLLLIWVPSWSTLISSLLVLLLLLLLILEGRRTLSTSIRRDIHGSWSSNRERAVLSLTECCLFSLAFIKFVRRGVGWHPTIENIE